MQLPDDRLELKKIFTPLIEEYINEIGMKRTVDDFLGEFVIIPIMLDDVLMGFWGVRFRQSGSMNLATVKAFYLKKKYRGRYLSRAADDLVNRLVEKGTTELEIWSFQKVQRWLEKRYKIKPTMYISHGKIEVFKPRS